MDEIEEWEIVFTKQAEKDARKIASAGLGRQVTRILDVVKDNPYATYPPYEKLSGDLQGYYSRRINIQHRFVYQILPEEKIIKVIRMWTHYES
ncbi:Txe/YoeB family addiction module toxin [Roseofilum sp. Belize Diploria]|uniref:Txe/YoeB family addiction module toxin n=1 Tax=Roseofilum sp. Belize Diploria TaxID=2821501 RepID=UPI001AFFF6C1|nr:Txe/YoeB family addiction module toxin [Roseofilum sp. Belize Diploria]MBP0010534.1 Txe/YoeB family addiction module toxin [Roseofilum sp. Belize Diploria]